MSRFLCTLAVLGAVVLATPTNAATFLFIRHAESKTNAGTATPEEMVDPPLTALGEQQAIDLAKTLGGLDLTTIYVSSYKRTSLTIAPTAAEFGLSPVVTPEIREWDFGTGELDYAAINDMFMAWLSGNTAAGIAGSPGSESLDDLNARVLPAYEEIIARHADEDGVIAIVGHGGSIGWTMPSLVENVSLPFALTNNLHNTGIVQVEVFGGKLYATNWEGTALDWPGIAPIPVPASGLLLIGAAGALFARGARRKTVA